MGESLKRKANDTIKEAIDAVCAPFKMHNIRIEHNSKWGFIAFILSFIEFNFVVLLNSISDIIQYYSSFTKFFTAIMHTTVTETPSKCRRRKLYHLRNDYRVQLSYASRILKAKYFFKAYEKLESLCIVCFRMTAQPLTATEKCPSQIRGSTCIFKLSKESLHIDFHYRPIYNIPNYHIMQRFAGGANNIQNHKLIRKLRQLSRQKRQVLIYFDHHFDPIHPTGWRQKESL